MTRSWPLLFLCFGGLSACDPAPPAAPSPATGDRVTTPPGRLASVPARLRPRHVLEYPTRAATGPEGRLYVTDARRGSVFVLEDLRRVVAELQGIPTPLGIAVSGEGEIYVGSGGRRRVDVYGRDGTLRRSIGEGEIVMPNDLALDARGRLYVADSAAHVVRIYDGAGRPVRTLRGTGAAEGTFRFPAAVAIGRDAPRGHGKGQELFVADQGRGAVHVFSLDGQHRRSFGERLPAFSTDWQGRFVRLQSLAVGADGLVYALDSRLGRVQVFEAATGQFVRALAGPGKGAGQLWIPLGLALEGAALVVANAGNHRLERLPLAQGRRAGGGAP